MFSYFIEKLLGLVWNWPVTILCLASAFYFTFRMGFIQFRCLGHAVDLLRGRYDDPDEDGQITHFQALSAALSGTIGLGNIAGVAIAISMGGPGAILWMWIVGLFGMATKYVECTLGTHYRVSSEDKSEFRGGPMYYIVRGLGEKWRFLGKFYAVCIILAGFGSACMFQSNQAASALFENYGLSTSITGIALCILTGLVIIGGIKRIGSVASKIVPFMCCVYVFGAILICLLNISLVPLAFQVILTDAFTGSAAAGGVLGTVVMWGVRRAIFSNEAGLGSAAIAHAAVKTNYPVREGIVASIGPLVDTIIVCTATALIIIMSGLYGSGRYISDDHVSYGFESSIVTDMPKHWQVIPHNLLDSRVSLKNVVNSKMHLDYNYAGSDHQPIVIGPFDSEKLTYRFSYFKRSGDIRVTILDTDFNELSSLMLKKGENLAAATNYPEFSKVPLVEAKNFHHQNLWEYCLLHLHESLGLLSSRSNQFYLKIEGVGKDVSWSFDDFTSVKVLPGIALTTFAFDHFFYRFGSIFITFAVFFFAFSTMITWSYYGETALVFLSGKKFIFLYKLLFVALVFYGAIESLNLVVNFSDLMIGLLVIPNTIALFFLVGKVKKWTLDYFKKLANGEIKVYR
ncbi:MAG: sodium:alanine symporter family protein [bacterium]